MGRQSQGEDRLSKRECEVCCSVQRNPLAEAMSRRWQLRISSHVGSSHIGMRLAR